MDRPLEVKVWADYALFVRPEFGVERVSYEVMTPSAACGVLSSIFWKPEFRWRVREIHVLRPIRRASFVRNEVVDRQSEKAARSWTAPGAGYDASYEKNRAQRHALCLRDVAYLIRADVELQPHAAGLNSAKYRDQFRRRVDHGRNHARPYFGTREFSAYFGPADDERAIPDLHDELGLMLYDVEYRPDPAGPLRFVTHDGDGPRVVQGRARPRFFRARLDGGVLRVPDRPDA